MPLNTKTKQQFLSDQVSTWASLLGLSPNLPSGSVALAIFQAATLGGLFFLQSQGQQIYNFARVATSTGPDVDSFMADFGLTRQPSTLASGPVQFGVTRVSSVNILVTPGTLVQTLGSNPIQYQVIADTTQASWNAVLGAYVLPAGSLSINVTCQALLPGSASNVQIGQLTQLGSSASGINAVTNLASILNGHDPETDAQFRTRFILKLAAVNASGTQAAFLSAAVGVQQGLNIALNENVNTAGAAQVGFVTVVVDDGSGSPPSALLNSVYNAIFPIRGFGIAFAVIGPSTTNVTIVMNTRIAAGANVSAVQLNVTNAVINYVNSLPIGASLYLNKLIQVAIDADPNVLSVQPGSLLLNGSAADLIATPTALYRTNNSRMTLGVY